MFSSFLPSLHFILLNFFFLVRLQLFHRFNICCFYIYICIYVYSNLRITTEYHPQRSNRSSIAGLFKVEVVTVEGPGKRGAPRLVALSLRVYVYVVLCKRKLHSLLLDEYFGESVRSCAGYIRPRRMESDIQYTLVEFLPMRRYFLYAGLIIEVPKSYRTVVRT